MFLYIRPKVGPTNVGFVTYSGKHVLMGALRVSFSIDVRESQRHAILTSLCTASTLIFTQAHVHTNEDGCVKAFTARSHSFTHTQSLCVCVAVGMCQHNHTCKCRTEAALGVHISSLYASIVNSPWTTACAHFLYMCMLRYVLLGTRFC